LDNGRAWVGFTAATGADCQNQDILAWSFHSREDLARAQSNTLTMAASSTGTVQTVSTAPQPAAVTPVINVVPVAVVPVSPVAPATVRQGTSPPPAQVVSRVPPVSVLGTWETTISGADQGFMIVTFLDDFTFSGYGLQAGLTNLFTIFGDWQYGVTNLTGHWWEQVGSTEIRHGTFSGAVSTGDGLKFAAAGADGSNRLWSGAPASDYPDLTGRWTVEFAGTSPFAGAQVQLSAFSPNGESYPAIFEIGGDNSGKLIVSSKNRVYGHIQSPSGAGAAFKGGFDQGTLTLKLEAMR
jgi:hypothetical protein